MRSAIACVLVGAFLELGATRSHRAPSVDARGAVTYLSDGVEVGGIKTAWKELRSLEDVAPDRATLESEYAARAAKRPDTVAEHLRLGAWARDHDLAESARTEFEAALALEPDDAAARKSSGFVRVDKEWKLAAEVVAAKRRALASGAKAEKLALAQWAAENGDPGDEWKLLVELAVADPWDRGMIARVKPIVERREPRTLLRPPLSGRWRAEVDRSRHHQMKVFAIEAIDFRMVDVKGSAFRNKGSKLEDFYGFDAVITACADGIVTMVEDQFPDLPPGKAGRFDEANYVSIEHGNGEWTDYGHVRKGSALVKAGDAVKAGQPIARVGNSGASGQPHLHFTLDTWETDESGSGQWISIPWGLHGFRVVEAGGAPCDFEAKAARVQEGWIVQFPEPK